MKKHTLFIFLCILLNSFVSCSKDETGEKWAEEEQLLAEYMEKNKPGAILDKSIYFEKLIEYRDNIQPETGDNVLVDFVCSFLYEGTVEQVSYEDWRAYDATYLSRYLHGGPELWSYEWWVSMGIGQMRENETANVYVPSRILRFQDFKPRLFWIQLRKVIDTDLKTYQETMMANYIKQWGDDVDTTIVRDNGKDYYIVYHVENEGTGAVIEGSSVKTHTSESYFLQDNDIRDVSINEEVTWTPGSKIFEILKSEKKGNKLVKKGGKITILMPYKMRYGDEYHQNEDRQEIIPMGSVLKYDISISN